MEAKDRKYPDSLGGPVVETPYFHCRGQKFDPWSGNWDPKSCVVLQKKKIETTGFSRSDVQDKGQKRDWDPNS